MRHDRKQAARPLKGFAGPCRLELVLAEKKKAAALPLGKTTALSEWQLRSLPEGD